MLDGGKGKGGRWRRLSGKDLELGLLDLKLRGIT
jgi:hypothetical protein